MRSLRLVMMLSVLPSLAYSAPEVPAPEMPAPEMPVCELAKSTTTGFRSGAVEWRDAQASHWVGLAASTTTGFSPVPVACVAERTVWMPTLCETLGWPAAWCAARQSRCSVQQVSTKGGATAFVITCSAE